MPNQQSKFHGLNYSTLEDYKTQLDLRPIRNIIVKQNTPAGDDTAIYEVFNRLNTGGVNLRPQEIRTSMYHSPFYDALYKMNVQAEWRELLQSPRPDLHMKDIEILLRGFAMLLRNKAYTPSMVRFLNQFSKMCESQSAAQNIFLSNIFAGFLKATKDLPRDVFVNVRNGRFNIALYEAVFTASLEDAVAEKRMPSGKIKAAEITKLATNAKFMEAALEGTTRTSNVTVRLEIARKILKPL